MRAVVYISLRSWSLFCKVTRYVYNKFWLVFGDFTWLKYGLVEVYLVRVSSASIIYVMSVGEGEAANWWRCQ